MEFHFKKTSIDPISLREQLTARQAGAFNCFEGRVRDNNENKSVLKLEYQAQESLAEIEMQKIFDEVKQNFDVIDVLCVHRIGILDITDIAVWIGVIAAHRDDSFKACRYLIDQLKARLPIWKKEHYKDEESQWIGCHEVESKTSEEDSFYARQTVLKDVGIDGQKKLNQARVLVVGAGGLGSGVLPSLAGAGIGTIGIAEHDTLEITNLHRQTIYKHDDVSHSKSSLAVKFVKQLNPNIHVIEHNLKVDVDNIESLLSAYDIIVDCTDNFKTKFLLNDACLLFSKKLVQASIYQYEGQIRTFVPGESPCLRCLWPQVPSASSVGNCQEVGVLGVLPALFGNLQALEVIKLILKLPNILTQQTLFIDLKTYKQNILTLEKNQTCPLCSKQAIIKSLRQENYEYITNLEIKAKDCIGFDYEFVDIRESFECMMAPLKDFEHQSYAYSKWNEKPFQLDKNKKYVFICAKGIRSLNLVKKLSDDGIKNVFSLLGGVSELNQVLNQKTVSTS